MHSIKILRPSPTRSLAVAMIAAAWGGLGCSSSSSQPATSAAAAVSGPADSHCTMNGTAVKKPIGMCVAAAKSSALTAADGSTSADASDDTASEGDDGGGMPDVGATLYNAEGDDDDCKYHVKWTSTEVKKDQGVTFEVNLMRLMDGKAATGADISVEAYLDRNHPTPTNEIANKESAGGNYEVGPFVFDAPGRWTVRFHFYETCSDEPEDSPHGHAAFFVMVP